MGDCALYLLFGDDDFRMGRKAREIVDSLVAPDQREFGIEIADARASVANEAARAVYQAIEALFTRGFFGGSKVVWLRDADFFHESKLGKAQDVKAAVEDLTATVEKDFPPGHTLVITVNQMDKRHRFYKTCKKVGAHISEFSSAGKSNEVRQYAAEQLRTSLGQCGLTMGSAVQSVFLERTGKDSRVIDNEMQKLASYLGDRRTVEAEDVSAVVCAAGELPAWDLLDAVGNRDLGEALRLLRQLLFQNQKESPIGLVYFLASRLQDLIVYRQALDRNWLRKQGHSMQWGTLPESVSRVFSEELKKNPVSANSYRAGILAGQAARYSMSELTAAYNKTVAACEQMVSGHTPDAMTLELLLIEIMARKENNAKKKMIA